MIGKRIAFVVCQPYLLARRLCPKAMKSLCGHSTLKGSFSAKSFCSTQVEATICWDVVAKSISNSRVPIKAFCFASATSKGKFQRRISFKEEILPILIDALCLWRRKKMWINSLCTVGGFLHFGISLTLIGISWVQPSNVRDVVVVWRRRMKKSWILEVWNMAPLPIWWATWKERNRHLFQDEALSFQEYKLYFLRLLFNWSIGLNGNKNLNFLSFVDCIMDKSLRAYCFCICPFCKWVTSIWCPFYIHFAYFSKISCFLQHIEEASQVVWLAGSSLGKCHWGGISLVNHRGKGYGSFYGYSSMQKVYLVIYATTLGYRVRHILDISLRWQPMMLASLLKIGTPQLESCGVWMC